MNVSLVQTMLLGASVVLSQAHGATAAPPAVQSVPLPGRNFPTEKELAKFLEPIPPPVIPDPPPHEGAMLDYPETVAPPDLVLVEVLEALPGRPISGERLVRPDGTVSLGFYGDLHVRGLTPEQVKVKMILHLRRFLPDDVLGLYRVVETGEPPAAMPEEAGEAGQVKPSASIPRARRSSVSRRARGVSQRTRKDSTKPLRAPEAEREPTPATEEPTQESKHSSPELAPLDPPPGGAGLIYQSIHPSDSDRVFVSITAYNHKVYFVQGDVAAPGRFPFTGNETVLDALNFAEGFLATAEPKDIRLVRPSAAGRPERSYPVDWAAILAGNAKANYQLFPGDRLIVGRNDVVEKTIQIDRIVAPFWNMIDTIRRYNVMVGSAKPPGEPAKENVAVSAEQLEAIMKAWVDLWAKAMSQPGGATLDEKTLRELMLKALAPVRSTERKE